ncbi:MAG: hypothetical protein V4772_15805 [Pseudomonadota bacterium]
MQTTKPQQRRLEPVLGFAGFYQLPPSVPDVVTHVEKSNAFKAGLSLFTGFFHWRVFCIFDQKSNRDNLADSHGKSQP